MADRSGTRGVAAGGLAADPEGLRGGSGRPAGTWSSSSRGPHRLALARALRRRAGELCEQMAIGPGLAAGGMDADAARLVGDELEAVAHLATTIIGRWLETGLSATDEEMALLCAPAEHAAAGRIGVAEVAVRYLQWRDLLLEIVADEAGRLDLDPAVCREVEAVVRASCDMSLVRVTRTFDRRRLALEAQLEAEQSRLVHRASHDALTGLLNRASLEQFLESDLRSSGGAEVAVLFVDVDHFKTVNDRFGHRAGDEFLVEVAKRLTTQVRPVDVVARLGGDEFVVVCSRFGEGDAEEVTRSVADRVASAMEVPVEVGPSDSLRATVSIGIALGHYDAAATVIAHADRAMYEAKRAGRARSVLYRASADQA